MIRRSVRKYTRRATNQVKNIQMYSENVDWKSMMKKHKYLSD